MAIADLKQNSMKTPVTETKQPNTTGNMSMSSPASPEGGSFFDKFPLLKKWWFWVAVLGLIVAVSAFLIL